MAPQITLDLNPPYNDEFYSTNDTISGTVKISLEKSLTIKRINVILKGFTETVTKVDPVNVYNQNGMMTPVQDNRSYHTLVNMTQRVFPPDNVWDAIEGSSKPFKVKPGQYDYNFKFAKLPKRPKCLTNHTKNLICFTKRETARMPPSFNNQWRDLTKIDNLDLFFYAYGKVLYMVQVQIELGKSTSWYRPFDKLLREIKLIEFIPQPQDIMYEDDDEQEERSGQASNRLRNSNNISRTDLKTWTDDFNMNPQKLEVNGSRSNSPSLSDRLRVYKSSYRIGLPDEQSVMWLEVRSRGLKETYRKEMLFSAGSYKFDNVFFVLAGNVAEFKKLKLVPTKIQLNLLETTTYLSQGVANENFSSLRLVEVASISPKIGSMLIDFTEAKMVHNNFAENQYKGRLECELKLKNHPILKKLKFNEEDYLHRGNRLYSFKTCTIKRIFNFQLLVDWEINGVNRQTEVIVDPMQIFVQTNEKVVSDVLPKYVDPPLYTEAQGEVA